MKKGTCSKTFLSVFVALMVASFVSAQAEAAGFNIVEHGTRAMGKGGAFVATADDGSANYYNPAGMTDIEGGLFATEFVLTYRRSDFSAEVDGEDKMREWNLNPNLFLVADSGIEDIKLGLAAFVPFGSSTNWNDRGDLRYSATFSQLKVFVVNPNVAYKVNDKLSLGVGLDVYSFSVETRKKLAAVSDAEYVLKSGTDHAVGWNAGILYKLDEKTQLGASYRSRWDAHIEGVGTYDTAVLAARNGNGRAEYNFPDEIMFGIAHQVSEKLNAEINIQWTNWSEFENVYIYFENPLAADSYTTKNWHDALIYKLGLEYDLSEKVQLRSGYAFSESPVPDYTWEPTTVDAPRHTIYAGWGYDKSEKWRFDLAGSLTLFNTRKIDEATLYDGRFETFIPQLSGSATYKF